MSERRGGSKSNGRSTVEQNRDEQKLKGHRSASRDVMKLLDHEPSNGDEPQQLLGDCATLGNHLPARF